MSHQTVVQPEVPPKEESRGSRQLVLQGWKWVLAGIIRGDNAKDTLRPRRWLEGHLEVNILQGGEERLSTLGFYRGRSSRRERSIGKMVTPPE